MRNDSHPPFGRLHRLNGFKNIPKILAALVSDTEPKGGAFHFVLKSERPDLIHSTVVNKNCKGQTAP
jgi:hypothetical protein